MKLLITGFFGMNNLGDDIMLDMFCREILSQVKDIDLTVALLNGNTSTMSLPSTVKVLDLSRFKHGKTLIFRSILSGKYDAFFWIGGTCFTENAGDGAYRYMNAFAQRGKKTGYLGVGIGDVYNLSKIQRYKKLLDQATLVTFRDVESYNQARMWSSNPELYCCEDLVHLFNLERNKNPNTILISWRDLKGYYDTNVEGKAIEELLHFVANHFPKSQIEVAILGSDVDLEKNRYIYTQLKKMMPQADVRYFNDLSTREKIEHISNAMLAILGRLHGIFIAETMKIRTIAIGYDNKSERFLKSIGRKEDLLYPDQISENMLNTVYDGWVPTTIDFKEKKEAAMNNIKLFVDKVCTGGVTKLLALLDLHLRMNKLEVC